MIFLIDFNKILTENFKTFPFEAKPAKIID